MRVKYAAMALGLAALALGAPAHAGKSDGTMRIAFSEPLPGVDVVHHTGGEMYFLNGAVFGSLFEYNATTKTMDGVLAERMEIVDPLTIMVYLKQGVTFHDGSAFDADDVVYTLNFVSNPDIKFRLKTRYSWIKNAEKVDDYTVRINLARASALAPVRLGNGLPIYPSDSHGKLADPQDWAKNPIGTGAYRVTSVEPNVKVVLERFEDYKLGPAPSVERIEVMPILDAQSRLAAMMVGDIDVMAAYAPEEVQGLASRPGFKASVLKDSKRIYLMTDAAGRSGVKPLTDLKVRDAIHMAIDRDTIRKVVSAAQDETPPVDRICAADWIGCPPGGTFPAYDPTRAKELLAEAGYPNGFPLEITTTGDYKTIAEAITGYLRAVGINASVHSLPFTGLIKKQDESQINMMVLIFSGGGIPDSGAVLDYFYNSDARDYARDDKLDQLMLAAGTELDAKRRDEILFEAFEIVDTQRYVMPLMGNPTIYLHTDEIEVDLSNANLNSNFQYGTAAMFRWAD